MTGVEVTGVGTGGGILTGAAPVDVWGFMSISIATAVEGTVGIVATVGVVETFGAILADIFRNVLNILSDTCVCSAF
mgnify:CR=1 FL=1